MWLDSFSFTSKGGRSYNQDTVGILELSDGAVCIVADGLGGHLHGEMASKAAVDTVLTMGPSAEEDLSQWLEDRICAAGKAVMECQKQYGNMKTTAAVLAIRDDRAAWAHVGDSRVYYFHDKVIAAVTEDHSVAYKKYQAGEITRAQIGSDEDQSSLLRALGNPTRNQPVHGAVERPLEPGDAFLLCSDGAWVYLQDEELLIDYLKADCAKTWAELLLLRIMARIPEGNDNLSIITLMVNG